MDCQNDCPNKEGCVYRIRVAAIVDESWSDRLGGLDVTKSEVAGQEGIQVTDLTGWLPDQAALFGVLNTLYNNRFVLLSVQCLPAD